MSKKNLYNFFILLHYCFKCLDDCYYNVFYFYISLLLFFFFFCLLYLFFNCAFLDGIGAVIAKRVKVSFYPCLLASVPLCSAIIHVWITWLICDDDITIL